MSLPAVASGSMTFSQHLVLWLHLVFVAFTIGPVTLAIMSTPRYIRQRDARIVRYLSRITFIFMLASLGVLIAGIFLAQLLHDQSKWWVIVSATLFVVAIAMLVLIVRDQRKAIRALDGLAPGTQPEAAAMSEDQPGQGPAEQDPVTAQAAAPDHRDSGQAAAAERARIAMMGGLVSVIWLVILVLMVWNS